MLPYVNVIFYNYDVVGKLLIDPRPPHLIGNMETYSSAHRENRWIVKPSKRLIDGHGQQIAIDPGLRPHGTIMASKKSRRNVMLSLALSILQVDYSKITGSSKSHQMN